METSAKERNFLFTFSAYRAVLFFGLCVVLTFFCIFGPSAKIYYFGEGNTYRYNKNGLAVHFIDVGHGDCIAVNLPDGKVMVIDGGEEIYYPRVTKYLETRVLNHRSLGRALFGGLFKGEQAIDYVVNTHPHSDHFGGLTSLIEDFNVGTVYRPIIKSDSIYEVAEAKPSTNEIPSADYSDFITASYQHADDVEFFTAGLIIEESNYRIIFHTPDASALEYSSAEFNETSCIITIEYNNHIFVLTGDAGFAGETAFMNTSTAKSVFSESNLEGKNVYLKVGHHGSNGSSSTAFLNFIKPTGDFVTVISVGTRYEELPNPQALDRLNSVADDVFSTLDVSNVVIRCDDDKVKLFFGFDNPIDYTVLIIVCVFLIFIICFLNYAKFQHTSGGSKKIRREEQEQKNQN